MRAQSPRVAVDEFERLSAKSVAEQRVGNYSEAADWIAQALPFLQKAVGSTNSQYAKCVQNLGILHANAREYPQAEARYLQAMKMHRELENHREHANTANYLTHTYLATERLEEAESLCRQTLKASRSSLGTNDSVYATSLNHLATVCVRRGRKHEAEALFRQALAIRAGDTNRFNYVESLNGLARLLEDQRRYVEAARHYRQAMEAAKSYSKTRPISFTTCLNNLANLLARTQRWRDAEPLYKQCLEIRKKTFGQTHPEVIRTLIQLADLHSSTGASAESEKRLRSALQITQKWANHPLHGECLHKLAILQLSGGRYHDAEKLFCEAIQQREAVLGKAHPDYAASLNGLANLYADTGRLELAEKRHLEAKDIRERALGAGHPDYARSLNDLANLYVSTGRFQEAEDAYLSALDTHQAHDDPTHRATCMGNLASLYECMGRFEKAEALYQQSMAGWTDSQAEHSVGLAGSLNNLANLYASVGRYETAEPMYRKSMTIRETAQGVDHPDYSASLNNLATLYLDIGDCEKAESLYRKSMAVWEATVGTNTAAYATCLNNLASLYERTKRFPEAEELCRASLSISKRQLGTEHPIYATGLNNLANLQQLGGRLQDAERSWLESRDIRRRVLGDRHPDYAGSLNNLAGLYASMGKLRAAEQLYRESLEIVKEFVGEEHRAYAKTLDNLAVLLNAQQRWQEAYPPALQAVRISRDYQDRLHGVLSKRNQLRVQVHELGKMDELFTAGLALGGKATEVYDQWLAWIGAVTERQLWQRLEIRSERARELIHQLKGVRHELSRAFTQQPKDSAEAAALRSRQTRLFQQKESLEYQLARESAPYAQEHQRSRIGTQALRQQLPENTVMLDYAGYRKATSATETERRLTVFVLRRDSPIRWFDLGSSETLAEDIAGWRKAIQPGGNRNEELRLGAKLRRQLWDRVKPWIGNAPRVLIRPELELARLPFGGLPASERRYLAEEHQFIVVPVAQRMARERQPRSLSEDDQLLVVGDVDYGGKPGASGQLASRAVYKGFVGWQGFDPLHHTRRELLSVRDSFEQAMTGYPRSAWKVKTLRRANATEDSFQAQCGRSRWIHLATHGFFSTNESLPASLRCGLALAGVNRRDCAPHENDGILTAEEVESLNLKHTELVVLSACQTGLGVEAQGEGLLGLQRAFQLSGARSVIASLWAVNDRWTGELMAKFYEELWGQGKDRGAALAAAQRAIMNDDSLRSAKLVNEVKRPKASPFYWAGFVLSGDW